MTNKLAVWLGVGFCAFVAILLLVLYYPKQEDNFDDFTRPNANSDVPEDGEDSGAPYLRSVARTMEDLGALFLALVAVLCIVGGISCLVCACCCMME